MLGLREEIRMSKRVKVRKGAMGWVLLEGVLWGEVLLQGISVKVLEQHSGLGIRVTGQNRVRVLHDCFKSVLKHHQHYMKPLTSTKSLISASQAPLPSPKSHFSSGQASPVILILVILLGSAFWWLSWSQSICLTRMTTLFLRQKWCCSQ